MEQERDKLQIAGNQFLPNLTVLPAGGGESLEARMRREVPVPHRRGIENQLTEGGFKRRASKHLPELQASLQEVLDQFPFENMQLPSEQLRGLPSDAGKLYTPTRPRPGRIKVTLAEDLPMLASHFDFRIPDNPFATNKLKRELSATLEQTKYGIKAREWKSAARALYPFVQNDRVEWILKLGLGSRPGLRFVNWRDALIGALWMESLLVSPEAADWSGSKKAWTRANTAGKAAVAGLKALSTDRPFGMSSRELGPGLTWLEKFLAPSVGLRGTDEYRFQPKLLTGQFSPIGRALKKSWRAAEGREGNLNLKALQKLQTEAGGTEALRAVEDFFEQNMDEDTFGRLLDAAPMEKDPAKLARMHIENAGKINPDLAAQAEKILLPTRKVPASATTVHRVVREGKAVRFINDALRKAGRDPLPKNRLGSVLLLAGILSAGLAAAGVNGGEDQAA